MKHAPSAAASADCVIIGGGPAGLTAATYLARFHLDVVVVDAGGSRALSIPLTRNHAGFPEGISGPDLLSRMRRQAGLHGVRFHAGEITSLTPDAGGDAFVATGEKLHLAARAILLATGVRNIRPPMPAPLHDDALARGLIRYCPICDGYEATDQRIAVLGDGERGAREALFLRSYSADVTLIRAAGTPALPAESVARLEAAGIAQPGGEAGRIGLEGDHIHVDMPGGRLVFDTLYPALGSDIHSGLARALGADCSAEGCIRVDSHQRTTVPGLYAAGDVVLGLDQISHAMGEGGVAATTIRNDLAERFPPLRAAVKLNPLPASPS